MSSADVTTSLASSLALAAVDLTKTVVPNKIQDFNPTASLTGGDAEIAAASTEASQAVAKATVQRELFEAIARRDPAMAALYITRKREEIASSQQVDAVLELARNTEKLEWIDHIVQMLKSGEYDLPEEDGSAESPDRTTTIAQMDTLEEVVELMKRDEKIKGDHKKARSFFDAVAEYLSSVLPADKATGSVHDMIMQATGTDYDPEAMKFDQFVNMLESKRSSMSQEGTRLSTEHQYARSNIDQIKLQMSSMIDQIYGLMSKLATFT